MRTFDELRPMVDEYEHLKGFDVVDVRTVPTRWSGVVRDFKRSPFDCIGRTYDTEEDARRNYQRAYMACKKTGVTIRKMGKSLILVKDGVL